MSKIVAKVSKIQQNGSLHIVRFEFLDHYISMMSLELNNSIQVGTIATLQIKPTNINLGKKIDGELSFVNQLDARVESISNGELLSSIVLDIDGVKLESIIEKSSTLRLDLQVGDNVKVLIKSSDISIVEVMDV